MGVLLIKNRYYSDYGLDYVFSKLTEAFEERGMSLRQCISPVFAYKQDSSYNFSELPKEQKTVIFWDKDVRLARALEQKGIRLLPNCAEALAVCDDKELTYAKLADSGVALVKTISAPLIFDVNAPLDDAFLGYLEDELDYPIVVKENVGSQGKQVYLAENRSELEALNQKLMHKPHIYQEFRGEFGADIRVYVLGGKAIASVSRKNTTNFKSNVALGGDMEIHPLCDELKSIAERVSERLKLGYGSVDFVYENGYIFIEANSNAYFRGIENLGTPISKFLADYIISEIK